MYTHRVNDDSTGNEYCLFNMNRFTFTGENFTLGILITCQNLYEILKCSRMAAVLPFHGAYDENEYYGMFPEKPIPLGYKHVYCLSAIGGYQLIQKVEKSLGTAPKETKLPTADGMTVDDTLLKKSAWMFLDASQVSEDVINETLEMIKPLTKVKGFYKGLCNISNGVANP